MTIDDQIKDEKLQYYFNREAAKISTLSSGKMNKSEYLTGEEILPSNQKQIEEAKFTYSPLEKSFEKQTKTIKDQGEKQVKAIEDNKQLADTNMHSHENELLFPKEKEIFKNIYSNRLNKIKELTRKIDYDDLKFIAQSSGNKTDFTEIEDLIVFLNNIKKGELTREKAKDLQEFNKYLKETKNKNWKKV